MNKKIPVSLAIAIAIVAMTITFSITMIVSMKRFDTTVASVKEKETMYNKIAELDKSVRAEYYGDIDDKQLYDTMGAGYLAGIGDKYAKYYTAAQYATYLNQVSGKLMGIGVDVVKDATGYARVISVYADSPAAEVGIQKGSYLTSIDGMEVKTLSLEAVRTALQGAEGTIAKVGVLAADLVTTSTVELSRRLYTVPSVDGQMVGETGYIRISTFNENTPSEFDLQLQSHIASGLTGLVLDVRGNASTDIENMVRVLDLLCPRTAIGSAVYKTGDSTSLGRTIDDNSFTMPIVLVTNSSTACAAELFSVTLRDINGAKIVGVRTAGHGSIQTIVEQTDGSALSFTVARIVPANAESSFNGVGVSPDFEIALTAAEEAAAYDLTPETDPQVLRAFKMIDVLTGVSTAVGQPETDPESESSAADENAGSSESVAEGESGEASEGEPAAEGESGSESAESESAESSAESESGDSSSAAA